MKHVQKSVLLWYSPQEMYDLVTGIAAYPQFLPWCDKAEVVGEHEDGVTARLGPGHFHMTTTTGGALFCWGRGAEGQLGNGMPIGACWARAEVARAFEPGDHAILVTGSLLFHIPWDVGQLPLVALVFFLTMAALYGLGMMLARVPVGSA